jgi:hypothetical protein
MNDRRTLKQAIWNGNFPGNQAQLAGMVPRLGGVKGLRSVLSPWTADPPSTFVEEQASARKLDLTTSMRF